MASLGTAITVAQSALALDQALIGVTGENIANLDNPSYARRQAVVEEAAPLQLGTFTIGTGVKLQQIISVRDAVLNLRIAAEQSDVSKSSSFVDALNQIEQLFPADGSGGISAALDGFWSSWQNLSSDPSSASNRTQVFTSSQSLVSAFQGTSKTLAATATSTEKKLTDDVAQTNDLLTQLASSNSRSGIDTPELQDNQDRIIGELSKLIDVNVLRNGTSLQVTTAGGLLLVSGTSAKTLQASSAGGNSAITVDGSDITGQVNSGSIRGELDVLNSSLPNLQTRLNTLANGVASAVNANYPVTFFSGSGAASLQLAISNSSQVQAGNPSLPGDNSIAVQIADLRNATIVNGQTASDYHADTVFGLGEEASEATAERDAAQKLLDSMTQQRQQVEGVSIDQEAANLMQYQRAYSAAARILSAVDLMMQTALSIGAPATA